MLAANVIQEMQKDILGSWVYSIVLGFCVLFCGLFVLFCFLWGGGLKKSALVVTVVCMTCKVNILRAQWRRDFSRSWLLFSIRSSHDLSVHADVIPR